MKGTFRLLLVCVVAALVGFAGNMHKEPPCKCEVTVHKSKRKGAVPSIVGILRDSVTQRPVMLAGVVIDEVVVRASEEGRIYCEVLPGKHTLIAKCFSYYFCPQKITAQKGDSIVCVFNMRHAPSDGPGDFLHK